MKKELLLRISFAFVILVWVGLGGYFLYSRVLQKEPSRKQVAEGPSPTPQEVNRPFQQTSPFDISDFEYKTYRSDEFGFELEYPAEYRHFEVTGTDSDFNSLVYFKPSDLAGGFPEIYMDVVESSYEDLKNTISQSSESKAVLEVNEINVSGFVGWKVYKKAADFPKSKRVRYYLFLPDNEQSLQLWTVLRQSSLEQKHEEIIDYMFNSISYY